MREFNIDKDNWPDGVSDGLNLPCLFCGEEDVKFDYNVSDEFWNMIVPDYARKSVVCLSCFAKVAKKQGHSIGLYIESLQFIGIGETVEFLPVNVFRYSK